MKRVTFTARTLHLALWIGLLAMPAHADSSSQRLERLERDLQSVQRQLYRGGDGRADSQGSVPTGTAAANLQVRLSALEEELRQLRGQVEESRYQSEQTARQLQLLQEDMEYRLTQIEQKIGLGVPAAAVEGSAPATAPAVAPATAPTAPTTPPLTNAPVTPSADPAAATPQNAKELYNYAIGLMNKAQYAEATTAFKQFIKQYPSDKLLGNAYYWLGETFYVREDYLQGADNFRQGFEAMPEGVKAPDNLLKLAMSLAKLDKKREACVVLQQIQIKYKTGPDTVLGRAARESDNLNCQP
ncbi:MAG: tol-pal system protein YbgF [Rickettsiales bacterium]|nr:tol-pal system protein YbgF [Rickettsiales bacterium]